MRTSRQLCNPAKCQVQMQSITEKHANQSHLSVFSSSAAAPTNMSVHPTRFDDIPCVSIFNKTDTKTKTCKHNMSVHSTALNDDTKDLTETDTEIFLRYQIFRNRDFFPRPNFSETETDTFLPRPNFPKPKPKPSKIWQKFRNREVSKPKCQSLLVVQSSRTIC